MRLLPDRAPALGKLPATRGRNVHSSLGAAAAIGLRGLSAAQGPGARPTSGVGARHPFDACRQLHYIDGMKRFAAPILVLALAALPTPAMAAAGNFTLVNKTGTNITAMSIRRVGTNAWQPLGASPSNGGRVAVAFANPDCAFDIRADLSSGGNATFSGVNLCDATTVTLNRGPSGDLWVDYD